MKNFIYLATIATTIFIASGSVRAQGYPYYGSPTTIYVPSTETTTTTTTINSAPITIYPNNNSFPYSTTTTHYGGGYPVRLDREYRQPTVIFSQPNRHPRAFQSTCGTSIIGSPIPSAVPVDRFTGNPCR